MAIRPGNAQKLKDRLVAAGQWKTKGHTITPNQLAVRVKKRKMKLSELEKRHRRQIAIKKYRAKQAKKPNKKLSLHEYRKQQWRRWSKERRKVKESDKKWCQCVDRLVIYCDKCHNR